MTHGFSPERKNLWGHVPPPPMPPRPIRLWLFRTLMMYIFLKKFLALKFHPVSDMPDISDSKIKFEGSKNAENINRSTEVEYCRR